MASEKTCVHITIEDDDIVESQEAFVIRWSLDSELPNGVSLHNVETTIAIDDNDGKLYQ